MDEISPEIFLYVYLAILLYYFISTMIEPFDNAKKWKQWLNIAAVSIVIIALCWWFWSNKQLESEDYHKNVRDEFGEMSDEDSESLSELDIDKFKDGGIFASDKGGVNVAEINKYSKFKKQERDLALIDEVIIEDDVMTYDHFKKWYLTPEFLKKYTKAMKEALNIKKAKLLQVRKQYRQDLAVILPKTKAASGINNILNNLDDKSGDKQILETTLAEIKKLLQEIEEREKKIDEYGTKFTQKCLITALNDPINGTESLTGRESIKDFLALQLYTFAQNPRIFFANFQNKVIYGPSGVGKTKLARVIGHVYASSGILLRNHVHIITKQSLTTAYVNETAKITRKLLLSNLESVVFIDEAYDLSPPSDIMGRSIDHGREAITEIVNFLDKMVGLSIIIAAGYEKEMESRFMSANEGLPRRFPHKLILPPYNSSELTSILMNFLTETCPEIKFNKNIVNYIYTVVDHVYVKNPTVFENQAGDMANLSGFISRSIYGTPGKKWPHQAEQIITSGLNTYLARKGCTLEILE